MLGSPRNRSFQTNTSGSKEREVPVPKLELLGRIVALFLNVILSCALVGVLLLMMTTGIEVIWEYLGTRNIPEWVRTMTIVTIVFVAIVGLVGTVMSMIRPGNETWRMNVVRIFAFILLGFLVFAIGFSDAAVAIEGVERAEDGIAQRVSGEAGPVSLDDAHAQRRAQAIADAYAEIRRDSGDAAILQRIANVRQWRPHLDAYTASSTVPGLDATRTEAVMSVESGGEPNATSPANARGLMQFIDSTALGYSLECGITNPMVDSCDPAKSVCMGWNYLAVLTSQYGGDSETALARYNWGGLDHALANVPSGTPRSFWTVDARAIPTETERYVPKVLAWDAILRHYDATGALPPADPTQFAALVGAYTASETVGPGAASREPGEVATRQPSSRSRWWNPFTWFEDESEASTPSQTSDHSTLPSQAPTSNVWYTARGGESLYDIAAMFEADAEVVATLNPTHVTQALPAGTRIALPDAQFVFHAATGAESYHDIATRYGVRGENVLRWNGRISDEGFWAISRSDCPANGCREEQERPPMGTQVLVKRS